MSISFERVLYGRLNARQKENYNFQKVSAVLAEYGFSTLRLTDDWQGADFIAQHIDGETFLKVQLKGRLTFGRKYVGKDLYIAFPADGEWYVFPHDEVMALMLAGTKVGATRSWLEAGGYSFPRMSGALRKVLAPYRLPQTVAAGED